MTNPQAGRRWSVLQIQSRSHTQDNFGQPVDTWAPVCTIQGRVRAPTAVEKFSAGQLTSQVTHAIDAWWTAAGVAAGMRAVYGTRIFSIQSVVNVEEKNKEIVIMCLELNGVV